MKRALFLILVLSFSDTAWGMTQAPYTPAVERNVGNNYTIEVQVSWRYAERRHYRDIDIQYNFLAIDVNRTGRANRRTFTVPYCITPEYQRNSRSVFLRVKHVPLELATTLEDMEKRRDTMAREHRVEFRKRSFEMGMAEADASMKPLYKEEQSLLEERQQIYEAALVQIQQQDWSYYIINKADETVTGPLSEQTFGASKAVKGKIIYWKPAPRTYEEYKKAISNSVRVMQIITIAFLCFALFVFFSFLYILFRSITYVINCVIYYFCKKKQSIDEAS